MSETTTTEPTAEPTAPETDVAKLQAELDKWKSLSRQNETRAKENAAAKSELEKLREASKTEFEKAVEAARNEGMLLGRKEAGATAVASEFRAAFAGRDFNVDAYLESVDVNRFMDDEGKPKTDSIRELVEKFAPKPGPTSTAHVQQTSSTPLALNGDPLLDHLKSKLGIS